MGVLDYDKIIDIGDTFLSNMDVLTIENVTVNSHFENVHGISKDSRYKLYADQFVAGCMHVYVRSSIISLIWGNVNCAR